MNNETNENKVVTNVELESTENKIVDNIKLEPNNPKYKSLGVALKSGDFQFIIDELNKKDEIMFKRLNSKNQDNEVSELDELLFNVPRFCYKNIDPEDKSLNIKSIELIKLLIDLGANPDIYHLQGNNVYLLASALPSYEVLDFLLSYTNIKDPKMIINGNETNLLVAAIMSQSVDVIDYLVKNHNFNINEKFILRENRTPFHIACEEGLSISIDKLIELKVNPDITTLKGHKPHHLMVYGYDQEYIEELIDSEEIEEIEKWKNLYEKVFNYFESFKSENKIKVKTSF